MSKAEVENRIDLVIGKRKGKRYVSKRLKNKSQVDSK
ncbi:hypothetical protein SAMN04490193_2239 [Pseudomonas marginalis]|jgi:hypothetical protein|nr:hypothetical protein SAMN04490193_2239 [Pseudomonas marginalis]